MAKTYVVGIVGGTGYVGSAPANHLQGSLENVSNFHLKLYFKLLSRQQFPYDIPQNHLNERTPLGLMR